MWHRHWSISDGNLMVDDLTILTGVCEKGRELIGRQRAREAREGPVLIFHYRLLQGWPTSVPSEDTPSIIWLLFTRTHLLTSSCHLYTSHESLFNTVCLTHTSVLMKQTHGTGIMGTHLQDPWYRDCGYTFSRSWPITGGWGFQASLANRGRELVSKKRKSQENWFSKNPSTLTADQVPQVPPLVKWYF